MERGDAFAIVQTAVSELLDVEITRVTEEARFGDDLDADSLDLVELVMALEERLDVRIPESELDGVETVGDALTLLLDKLSART
jgi:acyl carrier protein